MKNFKKVLTVVLVLAMALSMSIMLVGCKKPIEDPTPTSFVTMDVNPSVELVLDQNNVVMDVVCANQDAAMMLYEKDGIIGANVKVASQNIVDAAVDFKYISKDDKKNVSVNVTSSDNSKVEAVFTETSAGIKAQLDLEGIEAKVEKGVDYMLEKELELVKSKKSGIDGYGDSLTLDKYRLVKRAMLANVFLTMDEAVLMNNADLIKTIDFAKDEVKYSYDVVTTAAVRLANEAYNTAKGAYLESTYPVVYAQGLLNKDYLVSKKAKDSSLAAQYLALNTATFAVEKTTNAIRELIDNIKIPVYPAVRTALEEAGADLTELDKLLDANDKITRKSLEAYVNECYRNMSDEQRQAFDGKYDTTLKLQINDFETEAQAKFDAKAGTFKATLKTLGAEDPDDNLDINVDMTFNIESIDTIITKLHKATDAKYEAMMNNLTDAGKEAVKTSLDSKKAKISEAEAELKEAIDNANKKAETALKEAREKRMLELNIQIEVK